MHASPDIKRILQKAAIRWSWNRASGAAFTWAALVMAAGFVLLLWLQYEGLFVPLFGLSALAVSLVFFCIRLRVRLPEAALLADRALDSHEVISAALNSATDPSPWGDLVAERASTALSQTSLSRIAPLRLPAGVFVFSVLFVACSVYAMTTQSAPGPEGNNNLQRLQSLVSIAREQADPAAISGEEKLMRDIESALDNASAGNAPASAETVAKAADELARRLQNGKLAGELLAELEKALRDESLKTAVSNGDAGTIALALSGLDDSSLKNAADTMSRVLGENSPLVQTLRMELAAGDSEAARDLLADFFKQNLATEHELNALNALHQTVQAIDRELQTLAATASQQTGEDSGAAATAAHRINETLAPRPLNLQNLESVDWSKVDVGLFQNTSVASAAQASLHPDELELVKRYFETRQQ